MKTRFQRFQLSLAIGVHLIAYAAIAPMLEGALALDVNSSAAPQALTTLPFTQGTERVPSISSTVNSLGLSPAFVGSLTPLEDRGNTTYDPNTGLEWLDLRLTAGKSYQSIRNGWQGYTTSDGYRFATRNEVVQLFIDAGATLAGSGWSSSDTAAAKHLLSLFGTTLSVTSADRSWMFFDPSTDPSLPGPSYVPSAVFGIWRAYDGDQAIFMVPGITATQDYSTREMASALVRVVPEPSTWILFATALGTKFLAVRRRR
jgi:hypothetical protein